MKTFFIYFICLSILCFVSLAITYGYEEGTMRNKTIGECFTFIFKCFKFPLSNILSGKFFIISLLLNILIYSIILPPIVVKLQGLIKNN